MFKTVKIALRQQVSDAVPGPVIQQQPAKHAGLCLRGVGRNAQLRDLAIQAVVIIDCRNYG